MQLFAFLCLTLFSSAMPGFSPREPRRKAEELSSAASKAAGSGHFAFHLYRALAAASPASNIVFSPVSVAASLAVLALGARARTKTQLLECLGLGLQDRQEDGMHRAFQRLLLKLRQPGDGLQLSLGSALFVDRDLEVQDAFVRAAKTLYLAHVLPSDFKDPEGARTQINDYVANQTKGKIVDLMRALDRDTVLVLVSFIFFKAAWESSFSVQNTREQAFHVSAEEEVQVPMMSKEDLYHYLEDAHLSCRVVSVPYRGNATALFILPNKDALETVENGLQEKTLQEWLKKLRKRRLTLLLPRFSIQGSYQLEKALPKLGVQELFASQADLRGISLQANTHVSEMVHKAVVEVDESGTEAAGATGTVIMARVAQVHSLRLVFNRPFLVVITESTTHDPLFLGKVARP